MDIGYWPKFMKISVGKCEIEMAVTGTNRTYKSKLQDFRFL